MIGLTGNIGTGKSVVRRMLEHLGAYGIDADAISHRVIEKGAPGYAAVVDTFGKYVLDPDGEINRKRLGRIVFTDPEAMKMLEAIIHPLVARATDLIIQRAGKQVIVIEAIKLLEGNLGKDCNSIWVTYAPEEVQLQRLITKRGMSEAEARQRIEAQSPQEEKMRQAQVIIRNESTFEETWRQVLAAWKKWAQVEQQPVKETPSAPPAGKGELTVEPGKPSHAKEIAAFFREAGENGRLRDASGVMEAFGEQAFLLLRQDGALAGIAGWQVENLVVRTTELVLGKGVSEARAFPLMLDYIERQSVDLQCEVSFVFVRPGMAGLSDLWKKLGYQSASIEDLRVAVWAEAARESMPARTVLLYKQLRDDRVLRPI